MLRSDDPPPYMNAIKFLDSSPPEYIELSTPAVTAPTDLRSLPKLGNADSSSSTAQSTIQVIRTFAAITPSNRNIKTRVNIGIATFSFIVLVVILGTIFLIRGDSDKNHGNLCNGILAVNLLYF